MLPLFNEHLQILIEESATSAAAFLRNCIHNKLYCLGSGVCDGLGRQLALLKFKQVRQQADASSTIVCRRAKEWSSSLHCFGNLAFNIVSSFGHFLPLLAGIPNCLHRVSFDTVFKQVSFRSASVVDETVCSGHPCSSGSVSSGQVRTSFTSTTSRSFGSLCHQGVVDVIGARVWSGDVAVEGLRPRSTLSTHSASESTLPVMAVRCAENVSDILRSCAVMSEVLGTVGVSTVAPPPGTFIRSWTSPAAWRSAAIPLVLFWFVIVIFAAS